MLTFVFLLVVDGFIAAYLIYGKFLVWRIEVNNACLTPSHTDYDRVDRVPTDRPGRWTT